MNKKQREIINNYLTNKEAEALKFLEELVKIDSYSYDKNGVSNVSNHIKNKLEAEGIECILKENTDYGPHLTARVKGDKRGKILMVGHQDTAHKTDTLEHFNFLKDGEILRGPGVSDMKAGLVYMVYLLMAFNDTQPDDRYDLEILFTPDEEIGSPISKDIIAETSRDALAVFVLEPARPDGSIVISRKGSAHLKINIKGKAAHSGAFIEDGISANDELAQKMIAIKKLSDTQKDLTLNFGLIEGGVSNNIVSPHASATIHLAFWNIQDYEDVYKEIEAIVNHAYIKGTESELSGNLGMLPMENNEQNMELYEQIVLKAAADLNQKIIGLPTKGASEAGFTSAEGVPTICGMGPVGGNWHTLEEYLDLNSFLPRLKLFGTSILYSMKHF